MTRAAILTAALCVAALPAVAQSWRPIERECAHAINQKLGCASCGGAWPMYARCTVQRVYGNEIPSDRLEACIARIWQRRWVQKTCAACGPDPVAESIKCSGGE